MVGSLSRLRDECRRAKERLSNETATAIIVDLPGLETTVRMTRMELEDLIDRTAGRVPGRPGRHLERNRVPLAEYLGGGDDRRRRPHPADHATAVRAPPHHGGHHTAASADRRGRRRADRSPQPDRRVGDHHGPGRSGDRPPSLRRHSRRGGASSAVGALAWSEVSDDPHDTLETEPPSTTNTSQRRPTADRRCASSTTSGRTQAESRRRSPVLLFGLAAAAAVVAAVVFGLTTFTRDTSTVPAGTSSSIAPAPARSRSRPHPRRRRPRPHRPLLSRPWWHGPSRGSRRARSSRRPRCARAAAARTCPGYPPAEAARTRTCSGPRLLPRIRHPRPIRARELPRSTPAPAADRHGHAADRSRHRRGGTGTRHRHWHRRHRHRHRQRGSKGSGKARSGAAAPAWSPCSQPQALVRLGSLCSGLSRRDATMSRHRA